MEGVLFARLGMGEVNGLYCCETQGNILSLSGGLCHSTLQLALEATYQSTSLS